jgi:CRP-like cAMP-binding protein
MRYVMPPREPAGFTFDDAVARVAFLKALPPQQLERLRPYAKCRRVPPGGRVWREGDATKEFTFLIGGRAKLVKAGEGGRDAIVDLCGEGELLCSSAVSAFAPYCCSAAALGDSVDVLVISRRNLLEVLERSPAASRAFIREMAGREMRLARRIGELSSGQVEQRVATLLLHLADDSGVRQANGLVHIPIRLKRQDLAELCSARLETTIRVMRRLGRQGLVRSAARGFVVDRGGLERVARRGD